MIARPSRAALAVVALSLAATPAFAQGGQPPAGQPPVTPPVSDQPPGTPSGASVPVRELGAVEARSPLGFNGVNALRGLPDGSVFVNDAQGRRLVRLDASLQQSTIVADTAGAPLPYGQRPAGLLSYHGDSTILVDPSTLALLVLNPQGQVVRVMAPPRVNDINQLAGTNLGSNAFDPMGRLVYRGSNFAGFGGFGGPGMGGGFGPNRGGGGEGGRGGGGGPGGFGGGGQGPQGAQAGQQRQGPGNQPGPNRNLLNQPDSLPILRADFDKRKADTVAWVRVPRTETTMSTGEDGSTRMTALINPFPQGDDWALMSDGTIAVARVLDYRVDFYAPDGTRTSSGKLPFDWKRITDDEKQKLVDSLKTMAKEASDRAAAAQNAGGGGGGGRFRMSFEPVPPERLPDYVPPIRPGTMMADREGNVWLLPVTSSIAAQLAQGLAAGPGGMGGPGGRGMGPGGFGPGGGGGGGGGGGAGANAGQRAERREERQERRAGADSGARRDTAAVRRDSTTLRGPGAGPQPAPFQLVYDVVNRKGELVERVKLPPNRTLLGFGNDGVVYLGARDGRQMFVEKARRQSTR